MVHDMITRINLNYHSSVKSAVRPTKPAPKKRKRLPGLKAPMPTDYVGEKPEWEEFKQKGNKCVSTTSAAVPCKDPIPG